MLSLFTNISCMGCKQPFRADKQLTLCQLHRVSFCNAAPEAILQCYVAGQQYVLFEREKHCQHLLSQMHLLYSYLTSCSDTPVVPPLPESHDLSASDDEL